ncbi:MAG: transglutaminase family protein [Oscillospiraceae bacterium]
MKKNAPSDGILVFDRYYGRKPNVGLLMAFRLLFCAAMSASAMVFVFSNYGFRSVSLSSVAVISALSAAVFWLSFVVFRRRYVLPALFIITGIIVHFNRDTIFERYSYFFDEFLMLFDGRFFSPQTVLFNDIEELSLFNVAYKESMALGSFTLCCLFGLVCALSMKRRVRALPALLTTAALCLPRLFSEDFDFNASFVPFILLIAAAVAISLNYGNGLAVVRDGKTAYYSQIKEDERSFLHKSNKASVRSRISMQLCYYSKYATTGAYCILVVLGAVAVGCAVFDEGEALDFTGLYEYIDSLGEEEPDVHISMDDETDYFTSADSQHQINISAPARSNRDVIKVTFDGDRPIYLRGDIGVEFTGTGWISPINDKERWSSFKYAPYYRPAELPILSILVEMLAEESAPISAVDNITIEYLCQTDVVFLPAYTVEHSFYNNPDFDVYGDYCVRVSDSADNYVNTVKCSAVVPCFDEAPELVIEKTLALLEEHGTYTNDIYSAVVSDVAERENVIDNYRNYVEDNYLGVPVDIEAELFDFMTENGLYHKIFADYDDSLHESVFRYKAAAVIDEFLNTNYKYSLSAVNRGDGAVMRFLKETKSGHCSLYATAMTLMLREIGIPARYCTGFAVHPDSISGNSKVLKEKDMHAWVEVYIDEFGWVTFDPTSAAVNAPGSEDTSEEEHRPEHTTRPKQSSQTTTSADAPDETQDKSGSETAETSAEELSDTSEIGSGKPQPLRIPLSVIVIASAAAAITVILIFAVWRLHSIRVMCEKLLKSRKRSVKAMYNCIVDILCCCGLQPEPGEQPSAFYLRADKQYNAGLSKAAAVLEAAAFGSDEADSLRADVSELLNNLYNSAVRKSGFVRRYRIRRIIIKSARHD